MSFLPFDELVATVADHEFARPPALVANAHITGLGVARALDQAEVPVIVLDRVGDGVAPVSTAVDFAGEVAYPLTDPDGFYTNIKRLVADLDVPAVAFGCMDEWVHAFGACRDIDGLRLSFDPDAASDILNKEKLYARCEELGIPYPETYRLWETDPETAAERLGFPLVIKPVHKREFEEAIGTNVLEVNDASEFAEAVAAAENHDVRVLAQKRVEKAHGEDRSLASYVAPDGHARAVVGNATVRCPLGYGTAAVVETVEAPDLRERALSVLRDAGYNGISESEFVYDRTREKYVLLDVNTRPWKWIRLPVAAGANLPLAAYAAATGATYEADLRREGDRWVYLPDYLSLLAERPAFPDVIERKDWESLISGAFEKSNDLTTGVYAPSDPAPSYEMLANELLGREYYCSC